MTDTSKPTPSTARRALALIAGIASALFAALLLALAAFLAIMGADIREPVVFALVSIFPALIAIACLRPGLRTPALRLIGGITCLAMAGMLIGSYIYPNEHVGRRGRGIYFAMCAAAGALAVKGRWPSRE